MKRLRRSICCTVGIFTVACMPVSYAATGGIAGHIYSTDIRAYINDVEVPSYNIGGKTVVVIEDISRVYDYNDKLRTLLTNGACFNPMYLDGGEAEHSTVSGNVVGDVYETDIKTFFYDTEITSYNLGGKTAVALEDLGGFGEYNEFGARYFYDDKTRTIRFENIYNNASMSNDPVNSDYIVNNIKFGISDDRSHINAEFYYTENDYGGNIVCDDSFSEFENDGLPRLMPVMTEINGEEKRLGLYLGHMEKYFDLIGIEMNGELLTSDEDISAAINEVGDDAVIFELTDRYSGSFYLYKDVVEEAKAAVVIPGLSGREQTALSVLYFKNWYIEQDRFETDDYLFIKALGGTPHGGNTHLILIQNDGTYHDYRDDIEANNFWKTLQFDDVNIDRENETCSFSAQGKNYVIDLKTGEMKEI